MKFFRHLRKAFMEENKIRKYTLYAIGEILLVVIGILIALQVNNWNEERKAHQISDKTLMSLETELQEAKTYLENMVRFNNQVLVKSELYIYDEFSRDSLENDPGVVFTFTNYAPIQVDLPILEREISSDRLITGQDELYTRLRDIKSQLNSIENALFYFDEFWNTQVAPYLIRKRVLVQLHQNVRNRPEELPLERIEEIYDDEEYKNLVAMSDLFNRTYTEQAQILIDTMEETISMIENII
ncbi:MAG: DUF6090 family protein [Balneolaceae bacterium]|nr:DUF6090 family protein [Balneolaceae bacterium]